MTEKTPIEVVFAASHTPVLKTGDYELRVEHVFASAPGTPTDQSIPANPYQAVRTFRVETERFHLKPEEVLAVFPTDGATGDYENVLPHIILRRSTHPWENTPGGSDDPPITWMLLLLFDDRFQPEAKVTTLGSLSQPGVIFPGITLNLHQKAVDPVTIIDVPLKELKPLMPTRDDLLFAAHVRRLKFTPVQLDGVVAVPPDEEQAVVIGNRLPKPGVNNTVHLVSVEGRLTANGEFDFGTMDNEAKIRLVSLYHWQFTCVQEEQSFSYLVRGLVRDHKTLRLPTSANPNAEQFLSQGYIPVRHLLRQGGQTASWYRGPLVDARLEIGIDVPARTSDSLLRFYPDVAMLDVTYAAAWELGRLLTLQHKQLSLSLYSWKRSRHHMRQRDRQRDSGSFPLVVRTIDTTVPQAVSQWFDDLSVLEGVPFKYLVPDERLLPAESIRFFQVDPNWLRALLDGVYSLGRITTDDFDADTTSPMLPTYAQLSGCIIRSQIVPAYPHLLISGFDKAQAVLQLLRQKRLSESILLCLFVGELYQLDLHQKPEKMHFALELVEGTPTTYRKTLRLKPAQTVNGALIGDRMLGLADLAGKIAGKVLPNSSDVGAFALNLLETSERISFLNDKIN